MHIKQAILQREGRISVSGWIYRERGSNTMRFLVLRDTDDVLQCVIKKDAVSDDTWKLAESLKVESAVTLTGELKPDERAPTGVELVVDEVIMVGMSGDFPITKDQSTEHLANNRHLWLRSRYMNAILKVRHECFAAFREYFVKNGFYEYHSPIFQATQTEGGSDLFAVKYFDSEVYLSQSWQLYAEAGIFSLENIFTIAPTFRAENSKTSRHLTEFWMAEMEMAWCTFTDIQDHAEGVVKHIVSRVLERCAPQLAVLERDTTALRTAAIKPFERITYDKAIDLLDKQGMKVPWGKDLRTAEEERICQQFDVPVIVTNYPTEVKAFYMKQVPGRPDVVQGCDVLVSGVGEIIGGSQREEDIEQTKARLIRDGEDPQEYEMYLDTRRYGSVPHGGFGLGMERIIAWVCGLDSVKDAIPFPRTPLRYNP